MGLATAGAAVSFQLSLPFTQPFWSEQARVEPIAFSSRPVAPPADNTHPAKTVTMAASVAGSQAAADKPLPRDFSHYYSITTAHRKPNPMKAYYKFFEIPGIGNLAGGLPNERFFPFDTLEARTAKPQRWTPSPNQPPAPDSNTTGLDHVAADTAALSLGTGGRGSSDTSTAPASSSHITVPKALAADTAAVRKIDLATALQYGTAQGYPPLLSFIRQFSRDCLHPRVPYAGAVDVCLTVGSTDGFSKTLDMFVDPWSPEKSDPRDRPGLLCETFAYSGAMSQALPRGVQIVPVEADEGGMVPTGPGGLEDVLANWDYSKGRRPHMLYIVSMGHNPTGILVSLERRRALYQVCSRYDVLIVEDEPYWYLQFPSAAVEEGKSRNRPPAPDAFSSSASDSDHAPNQSGYPFLDSLVPSFLSLDTDGRVIRLDTFSKTVAPGCRLGWITAQPRLIERYVRITESGTQQPSGFVQSVMAELVMGAQPPEVERAWLSLTRHRRRRQASAHVFTGWQMDGWVRWVQGLRGEYERRMVRMCRILDAGAVYVKHGTPRAAADAELCVLTKTQLYDFRWPRGGMFVWVRVYFENHPLYGAASSDGADIIDGSALCTGLLVFLTKKPNLVLVSTGLIFSATDQIRRADGWRYFRLCFAAVTEENVDACSRRFARGVRKFWGVKTAKELEDLVRDSPAATVAADEDEDEDEDEDGDGELANMGLYFGC